MPAVLRRSHCSAPDSRKGGRGTTTISCRLCKQISAHSSGPTAVFRSIAVDQRERRHAMQKCHVLLAFGARTTLPAPTSPLVINAQKPSPELPPGIERQADARRKFG